MDDMIKKATTDLTEEIIQLRAENMVYKTTLDLADENIKELHTKLIKAKKGKIFWIGVAAVSGIVTIKAYKKWKEEVSYNKWKAEREVCNNDFDEFEEA